MDVTALTLKETAGHLAAGNITSVDLAVAYLERIEILNPKLNAYLSVWSTKVKTAAVESDKRRSASRPLGPLDGIPIAIKDNFSTKGQTTTAGSKILADYQPLYNATVVHKLIEAGAIILGKTNLDEFAMGSSTENSAFGVTRNPWDLERVAGGSSGGSAAAVAADLCVAALGSDTGGSIRQPASFCGVVGFKPTYGLVSRYGLLAMASSFDQIGPLTKSVADARLLLEIISGPDRFDATTIPALAKPAAAKQGAARSAKAKSKAAQSSADGLKKLTIGVPQEFFGHGLEPGVNRIVQAAINRLKQLGAAVEPVSLPHASLALAVYYIIVPVEVASNLARYDGIRYGASLERETGQPVLLEVYRQTRAKHFGAETKRRIMLGSYVSSAGYAEAYYHQALKVQTLIRQEFEQVFQKVDFLAAPVSPTPAFKIGEKSQDPLAMYLADINTVPVNVAGLPGISLPVGLVDGLPVGLQLIGPRLSDYRLLDAAEVFEQSTTKQKAKM